MYITKKITEFLSLHIDAFQLEEFRSAMVRRDDVIKQLSSSLQATIENRDSLQSEYMTQASQLAQQVQLLQAQLKQVRFGCRFVHIVSSIGLILFYTRYNEIRTYLC